MKKLLAYIIGGIIGIFLAMTALEGVLFDGPTEGLVIVGVVIGLLNFFLKPIVKVITIPFRIITLGLFDIIIHMAMIWGATVLYPVLQIPNAFTLLFATLIVWFSTLVAGKLINRT